MVLENNMTKRFPFNMKKEFYNIWIILVFFSILFQETIFRNTQNLDLDSQQVVFSIPQNNFDLSFRKASNYYQSSKNGSITELERIDDSGANISYSVLAGGPVVAAVDPSFATICSFEELQLTASGGNNYLWVPNPGNPSGGALSAYNISNPIFSNGFPGSFYVYDVIVTDDSIPVNADTASVIISVLNNPLISISPSPGVFVCENEEVILTASGGVTYRWEEAVSGDSLGIDASLIVNPSITTTYRVTGYDSNGCYETIDIKIFVEQINAFANASQTSVCEGDSVLLTGGSGNQLTWSANNNIIGFGSSVYVTPSQSTIYNLHIQNTSGCQDSAQVTVEYYNSPAVLNPINTLTSCSGNIIPVGIQINQLIQSYTINGTGSFANDEIHGNLLAFDAIYAGDTTTFSVTLFGENGGCSVIESFQILPCACVPPVVSGISIIEAICGGKDGSATIYTEDEGAYFYNWIPDLGVTQGAGNSRIELPFGAYQIEIIDTSNLDCSSFIDVLITNTNGPEPNVDITPANCSLSDGIVILTPSNYDYFWEDLINSNSRNDLSSGSYFITITDPLNPDCSNVISIKVGEESQISAMLTIDDFPDCGSNNGSVSIQTINGSGDYTFFWQDGLMTSDSLRNGLSSGVYEVLITDDNSPGCEYSLQFVLSDSIGTAQINLNEVIDATCNGASNGSVDYVINYDTSFVFDADTIITDGTLIFENGKLPAGEYCLYLLNGNDCIVNQECFSIKEPETFNLLFEIEPDCGLGGSIDLSVWGGSPPYSYFWSDIPGVTGIDDRTGLAFGVYALTVTDSYDCTIFDDIITLPACSNDCDYFGGVDSLFLEPENCFSLSEFCFPVPMSNLINCQILDNGSPYSGVITNCDNDTFPNGYLLQFEPGYHEIIITDTLNDCYNILIVNVTCSNTDNVCINQTIEFCVTAEDLNLIGEIASMTNLCADTVNYSVSFEFDLNNLCVRYEGKSMGVDTACVEVCDFLGNCESFELRVTVDNCLFSTPDFLEDTIFINETVVYCPDTSELAGEVVSIDNFCPGQSGNFVDFFLDQNNFCVEYTGLETGVDTACIVICDDLGFCDTTFIYVVVEESFIPPIAVDDCDSTNIGAPVVINILVNDTLNGRFSSAKIITQPMWGAATVNLDRSVTYNASEEYCERIDSFTYEVCTDAGCDTASVCVWIACVDIFVFTAVSANKDGVNDVFYIAGIEDYPESVLRIFNRWGNLVYEKMNYKNTWSGTYKGNNDLPDGTYFYLLELKDENNRVFKGYLELFR